MRLDLGLWPRKIDMSDALTCARTARGTKRRCPSCEKPFYDLELSKVTCPYCGESVRPRGASEHDATASKLQQARVKWSTAAAPLEPAEMDAPAETHEPADNDQ